MSTLPNIYEIDHNMDMVTLTRLVNTNFKRLAHTSTQIENHANSSVVQAHNDLTHRTDDDCHPIKSITSLEDIIEDIRDSIEEIQSDITTMKADIATLKTAVQRHASELADHERRIKALEDK